eukprot:gene11141-biopygen8400
MQRNEYSLHILAITAHPTRPRLREAVEDNPSWRPWDESSIKWDALRPLLKQCVLLMATAAGTAKGWTGVRGQHNDVTVRYDVAVEMSRTR